MPEQNHLKENILKPGEIITEFIIPNFTASTSSKYIKFIERGIWDFSIVSIALVVSKSGNKIKSAKIVFGGVAPIPWVDENSTRLLHGMNLSDKSIEDAAASALVDAEPMEKNRYKIPLARNLVKKILTALIMY